MGWKPALALCMALALFGCMSSGTDISDAQLDQFVRGKTTETEVVAKLGAPTERDRTTDGTITLMYTYSKMAMGPQSFIPIVGTLFGSMDMKGKVVRFTFSRKGVLTDWSASDNSTTTNSGLLNQH